jgi:hypothetical protein
MVKIFSTVVLPQVGRRGTWVLLGTPAFASRHWNDRPLSRNLCLQPCNMSIFSCCCLERPRPGYRTSVPTKAVIARAIACVTRE